MLGHALSKKLVQKYNVNLYFVPWGPTLGGLLRKFKVLYTLQDSGPWNYL
jgi:hypothetical protein